MVRSSVVSAVSSACEMRLVPDWRCFWSTNSKCTSSLTVPGAAAAPCVDQLVSSTQKAEPQDACVAPAAARSAAPPEHAIANRLFISFPPEISSRVPVRSEPGHAQQNARLQPYATEPFESGVKRRGARRRGRIERGLELRLGEKFLDPPGGAHRTEERGRRSRN